MAPDAWMDKKVISDSKIWCCNGFDGLLLREWEGEFFVFNPASGDTHVMNALSLEILRILDGNNLSLQSLICHLQVLIADADLDELYENVRMHLLQLDAMGLVTPFQSDTQSNSIS